MNHTPGPWKVHHYSHINKEQWLGILNGAFDITHNGASNPAVVACSKYSVMSAEENLANANLMAAAPDLLEACKAAKKYLEPDLIEPGRTVFWDLVHAIDKVQGENT